MWEGMGRVRKMEWTPIILEIRNNYYGWNGKPWRNAFKILKNMYFLLKIPNKTIIWSERRKFSDVQSLSSISHMPCVSFLWSLNKLLKLGFTIQIYSLSLVGWKSKLSFTRPRSRCQQDCFLLEAPGENMFFPASRAAFLVFLGLWLLLPFSKLVM